MRKLVLLGFAALFVLAGCGGGSGSVAPTSNNGSGSGSGSGGGGGGTTPTNTITMTVDAGPDTSSFYDVDTPFITVTVCAPGSTTNCQQIDHVEVDSGSYGLRIISTVLNASLASALTPETGTGGNPLVECTAFADGFSWGSVKLADVQIAGESAHQVPMQVMGDPSFAKEIPTACSNQEPTEEDTVVSFGANGILGIGPFASDCGSGCATSSANNAYFTCPANGTSISNCQGAAVSEPSQVTNPVVGFQTDNNGVIIELPSVTEGASGATGTLIFGIGTESNNTLGSETVLTADPNSGNIFTTYMTQDGHQQYLPYSYFDTGSNAYYFADDGIPSVQSCSTYPGFNSDAWFCPSSELKLSATNAGQNGTQSTVSFSIGNAYTLFNSSMSAVVFDDLGASSGAESTSCENLSTASSTSNPQPQCSFDFGFPFFLGRNVYIAFAGANTAYGAGPWFAY